MKQSNPTQGQKSTPDQVSNTYERSVLNLKLIRNRLKRPLTLAEKIFFGHLTSPDSQELIRGKSYLLLSPDRVAMQDVSGQMALLQFMLAGRDKTVVPTTVHCDHLIQASQGKESDLKQATADNQEVYNFLATASSRYGIGFWKPGSGIIHQVILENYAFPGGLIIGTDSHTVNAGGLGMCGSGVGGSDAADVMAGMPWEVKNPKIIGVHLKGQLNGWASAKDVILKLCGLLTTKGATDKIVEYFGEGTGSISCTGKATIANMGAELGATSSIFPFDDRMTSYLNATGRTEIADLAQANRNLLVADHEVIKSPEKYFDEVFEIDLSALEPHVVGPHSPDLARPISQLGKEAREKGWTLNLSSALIGSCTNSSYEDIGRAASIAQQVLAANLKMPQPFFVSPGSTQIYNTIERDGMMKTFEAVGATIFANACGPCIGQWKRSNIKNGEKNTIINSFNRNFRGRNDANEETLSFIASPEIVMALGLAGRIDFNPLTDQLETSSGPITLLPPNSKELPAEGFLFDSSGYQSPIGSEVKVQVDPMSNRLQLLSRFPRWNSKDFEDQMLLAKVRGKCTTDHISPAGAWLRFRGHLTNISENLLLGGTNAFTSEIGKGENQRSMVKGIEFSKIARDYQQSGKGWIIVGDENYGEGSSREHAAMSPRLLGCSAVIVRSFARIHETNLKKQGVLALTFKRPEDYECIRADDRLSIPDLSNFGPGKPLTLEICHSDGTADAIELMHSYTIEHIEWFKAGSALNWIGSKD